MQDKHSNDFDLQLRSILSDAEVKPSRRVWKAVSARLDAASAPAAQPWGWMKWAGMAFAAAAVVATLFLTGIRHSVPTIIHNQEQALLAQAGGAADVPTVSETPAAAPAGELPQTKEISRPAPRRAAVQRPAERPVDGPEVPAVTDEAETSAPTGASPVEMQEAVPARALTDGTPAAPEPLADLFDEPAPAVAAKAFAPRIALYAQGAVGSNDSDFRPSAPPSFAAPGQAPGFLELGSSTYGVPFTLGLGVRIGLLPRFSVATGLDYSLLTRTFTGTTGAGLDTISGSVAHTVQYIGIPLNLYYDILSSDKIKFYVYGGGEIEYCISNKYRLFANPDIIRSYPVNGLQFSVGGGIGVEFRLTRVLGLYLDPGVSYYFPGNQPRSIRTDKPFLLNFDAGLRFNF